MGDAASIRVLRSDCPRLLGLSNDKFLISGQPVAMLWILASEYLDRFVRIIMCRCFDMNL